MSPGWSRVTIAAKLADVFDPPNALPFVLLFLHPESGETPAASPAFTRALSTHRLRCVAPHGARSWWVDRVCLDFDSQVTAERYAIDGVLPWIEATWKAKGRAVAIAGMEMGGQGAVRLAFRYPERFAAAASLGGAFDFHDWYGRGTPLDSLYPSREHARQDTAILHIPPRDTPRLWFACSPADPWYRGNDRLHEKLAALGIEHKAELAVAPDYTKLFTPMLDFIVAALEKESRRLS